MFHPRTVDLLATAALGLAGLWLTSCAQRVTVRNHPFTGFGNKSAVAQAIARRSGAAAPYNTAVAGIARKLNRQMDGELTHTVTLDEQGESFRVKIETAPGTPWTLSDIEAIRPTEFLGVGGMRKQVRRDGIGAPVILKMGQEDPPQFTPPTGLFVPATAMVEPSPESDPHDLTFTLFDPLQSRFSQNSLAADYTAGPAATLAKWHPLPINLPAMLTSEPFEDQFGLTRFDPVYPQKIPVVFIHGLNSSSNDWKNVINELRAHPLIRERFEFWVFGYGTGAPTPYSAMLLRNSLRDMAAYREKLGASSRDMILVGHSMGGLLSRIMTTSAGDEDWFRIFKKPLAELDLPEENRQLLRDVSYYESLPFVKRVVFIAAPHRGSKFAENPISRLASGLIRLPKNLLFLTGDILQTSLDALTPFGREVVSKLPTSIDLLESDSILVKHLAETPLNPSVAHHSIIGDRGKDKGDLSSDGIVTYRSAHLDGAISEKIVPANHISINEHPKTIAEIERILLEHLDP